MFAGVTICFGAGEIGFGSAGSDASISPGAPVHFGSFPALHAAHRSHQASAATHLSDEAETWLPPAHMTVSEFRHVSSFLREGSTGASLLRASTTTRSSPRSSKPQAASGMRLIFSATFSGTQLDTNVWSTCYWWATPGSGCTNFGNPQEQEWYEPTQDDVSDGVLHLVATKTPTVGTDKGGASKIYPYTSGIVTTDPSFSFTYGYVQFVAQIPGGTGTWPALWMMSASQTWPPEIDIMENWGSPNTELTTFHWGIWQDPQQKSTLVTSPSDLTAGWHTYGLAWAPGSLTWYLDGKVVDTYTGTNVPDQPMYLLANLAIDGAAASGARLNIRSVQVWQY